MLSLLILALWSGAARATGAPTLGYDPNTVKSCVEWYNNGMEETCEEVRDYFNITPEQFSSWNPSIGLDCQPWEFQSYCIVTKERLEDFSKSHTTSTTTKTTTSSETSTTTPLGPSPTAWTARGCYAESSTYPVLKTPMSGDGDAALTIPKCQDLCYRQRFPFAGVKEGNQCWCSPYIAGEHSRNQTDCNLPCTGDKTTTCGGKDRLQVFEAAKEELPWTRKTTTTSGSSNTASASGGSASSAGVAQSSAAATTRANSGAMRNLQWF